MNYRDVRNNIFIAEHATSLGIPNMNYNYYSTDISGYSDANAQNGGDPFTDSSSGDFSLTTAIAPGYKLGGWSELYGSIDEDPNGTIRGSDGSWDRGALEFSNGSRPSIEAPIPIAPTNLRIIDDN